MDVQAVEPGIAVVHRLRDAINEHDLEALVDVFDPNVISETPAHPQRTFRGPTRCAGTGSRSSPASRTSMPVSSTWSPMATPSGLNGTGVAHEAMVRRIGWLA